MTAPLALLFQRRVRVNPRALYWVSLAVILGFITNRLNISVTGVERASGVSYVPKWTEIAVTLFILGLGFALFRLAVRHLPVFSGGEHAPAPVSKEYSQGRDLSPGRTGLKAA